MKKIICLVLLIKLFPLTCLAGEGWYFKSGKPRPQILGGASWVEENPDILYMGKEGDKTLYLTFDAGYGNENLVSIANTLKETQTTAAIFVLPAVLNTHGDTVKELADIGCFICNHSYSHRDMSALTEKEVQAELEGLSACAREKGIEIKSYFRPPEGRFDKELISYAASAGYKTVFWSYAYADWDNANQPDKEKSLERLISNLHDGAVILLHPNSKTNAEILPLFIRQARSMGYRFGNLDELAESVCPA